ncbi:hypothetical protein IMZ48_08445 [Candidatus Bathyarchaeota archaeon]|nr:hypothetical protein [Candidatus Bathyarchaeota archaeon]
MLVNAIGIAQSSLLMKTDWQEVSAILAANLTLTIAACKAATKPLLRTAQESDCQ